MTFIRVSEAVPQPSNLAPFQVARLDGTIVVPLSDVKQFVASRALAVITATKVIATEQAANPDAVARLTNLAEFTHSEAAAALEELDAVASACDVYLD